MDKILEIYLNYNQSEEYYNLLNSDALSKVTKECDKLLASVLNDDLQPGDKEDTIATIGVKNEYIGFYFGFKYAMELMNELKGGF